MGIIVRHRQPYFFTVGVINSDSIITLELGLDQIWPIAAPHCQPNRSRRVIFFGIHPSRGDDEVIWRGSAPFAVRWRSQILLD